MKSRILVIDDEAEIRRSVRMILEYEGYDVIEASSGPEGVALAEREAPDLVFLDIKMPGMDGLDNRPHPRAPEPSPGVPLGLIVRELDKAFMGRLEVPDSVHGVIVSRVDPTGAAFSVSIRRGFVIMEINRKPVHSVADYQRLVSAAKPGEILALYYYDPT